MDDETVKKKLGAEIKRQRIAAGWSQQQFASMLGMNRTRLREIENGTGNPQLSTLFRVADGLGTTLPILFGSLERC
ncbi:helix-turn-helix domain-containing protein [Arabiibacter massiliensis]|uniref:helix-turn-helix domain-containing protein n=1 Tax=Arabiibacter massiliensis TaxID=1870985 RepID=UPI00155AB6B3|nr:helix-turn-helix transcriptional regulator [Arabiibacter massiliensis]